MLISQNIPNLVGGVSQQPPALRPMTCGEICDNVFPSPIDGLTKRPPTTHIKELFSTNFQPPGDPFIHWLNRDVNERYVMTMGVPSNPTFTFNNIIDGSSHPLFFANAGRDLPYCTPVNSFRKDFRAVTIADTTYLVNTTVSPKLLSSSGFTPQVCNPGTVVISIKQATNNASYAINIGNALAGSYTAPGAGAVSTFAVAAGLVSSLIATGFTVAAGWQISANGSYIYIYKTIGGAAFPCEVLDSLGGTAISFILHEGTSNQFSQLPEYAYHGMVQRISGDLSVNNTSAYYVQFVQSTYVPGGPNLFPGPGSWQECPGPGVLTQIDPLTMPLQIERRQDDAIGTVTGVGFQIYFFVDQVPWNTRTCGDDVTNTPPSFIGNPIQDAFFYQGRLGFLAGQNVLASETANYTNFWRTTVVNLQDNDFIDIQVTDQSAVKLRFAVPWQQQLVLFGDLKQFIITGSGVALTPSNVTGIATTTYDSDIYCKPCPVQNLLYFPYDLNGYVGLREYYVEYYTQKHVGKAVTDSVPKYLPGSPLFLEACNSADMLVAGVNGDPGSLYVYKYLWQGNTLYSADKQQSAWVRWNWDQPTITTQILGAKFYGTTMYLILARASQAGDTLVFVESLTVDSSQQDSTVVPNFLTHLDRRFTEVGTNPTYNATLNRTTLTMPYLWVYAQSSPVVVTRPGGTDVGVSVPVLGAAGFTLTLSGNWVGVPLWIGVNYTMRFRFSPFMLREPAQQGGPPIGVLGGKTQVRTLTVRAANTGYFRLEVNPRYRTQSVSTFTGEISGSSLATIGSPPGMDENIQVRTMVGANANEVYVDLVNDSPLPCRISNAEFELLYYNRAKRS